MITVASPEDLTSRVGEHLGWSEWHEVTQAAIDHFAEATGNKAPIHTDPEFARQTPYGGTIAFGMQILAMTTFLMNDVWDLKATGGADLGSNKVRHLSPVVAGQRVRVGATVVGAEPVEPNGVRATLAMTFEIEGSERPACVAEIVYVYTF